ncbi:sensor histidine kinase N-terminal domain-containing protein [Tropicimonas sp. IMCC34043]|uniref:sensor histidine kinase n=1 Tax=Tropicimonas sp. IMCC34043 TaxID=2248760 RepID=UPI001E4229F7|nr:sensor histidine kinase N-terminal domain-containing protein [Tropicimonas sp. IMCC34043]
MMALGFLGLLLIISALLWRYSRAASNHTYDLLLAGAALSVLERVSSGPSGITVDLPTSAMDILALAPDDRVVYRVYSMTGGEITGTPALPGPRDDSPSSQPAFYDAEFGAPFRFVQQGRQLITPGGQEWVVVQIGQTRAARTAQQWSLFLNSMAGLAAVSLIGLGFVWLAIRTALAPLRELAMDLRRRDPDDLSQIEGDPPREIRSLFDAINGFIARLHSNRRLTETFIADVAHQTRTSLSALQGQLGLAADATSFEQMKRRVIKAESHGKRTVRLTNQLLAHAMVIHRSETGTLRPVALKPLVTELLTDMHRDLDMRGVTVTLDADALAPGEDLVRGDAVSIREALSNLLENARRHGPPDNTIDIMLESCGPDCLSLIVEDAGPGIAPADRGRATERFTSIARDTAGSGLGLSIVRAVADSHDAHLLLGTSRHGGLRAEIRFRRLLTVQTGRAVLAATATCLALLLCAPPAQAEAQTVLTIASSTDAPTMVPLIAGFEALHPGVEVAYLEYQTVDLYQDILNAAPDDMPDLVISSAMDLQVDLVNRGLARRLAIPEAFNPPEWAVWRSELFGFTFEPAAIIYNLEAIEAGSLPQEHRELANFIRDNEDSLQGKIGTYDLRRSGIGYLYATQDVVQGLQAQRMTEVMGRAHVRTYCCTSEMIEATARGDLAIAINTIGSYALGAAASDPRIGVHFMSDYNLVMARTVFVPQSSQHPDLAQQFVAFMLSDGQKIMADQSDLIPIQPFVARDNVAPSGLADLPGSFLPIRLGPGLLTYLDARKKAEFLSNWDAAVEE